MKYQGQEIQTPPSIDLILGYLYTHTNIVATAGDIFGYWNKKGWKTKKGAEVKTLEAAIDVCNSIVVQRNRKEKRKLGKKQKKKNNKTSSVPEKDKERKVVILPSNKTAKEIQEIQRQETDVQVICNREYNKAHPEDASMKYVDQLNDARWYAFRKFIFYIRGKRCELCGSEDTVQVHHPHYITGRKAWEYNCNEVVVLCRECHKVIHNK